MPRIVIEKMNINDDSFNVKTNGKEKKLSLDKTIELVKNNKIEYADNFSGVFASSIIKAVLNGKG